MQLTGTNTIGNAADESFSAGIDVLNPELIELTHFAWRGVPSVMAAPAERSWMAAFAAAVLVGEFRVACARQKK